MLRSETATAPARMVQALAGLRAYQEARRAPSPPPMPVVARAGRAVLRSYGGSGAPLVIVPSLVNPPDVLDLAPGKSLLRWLTGQGFAPLLVDWGEPGAADRGIDLAGHVSDLLIPLLAGLEAPPLVIGYCLGGTLALALASLRPVRALALLAAPWRFSAYPPASREAFGRLWREAGPGAEQLGVLPMEALQAAFWQIDPARTVAKFERFAALAPGSADADAFVRLEDWANGGAAIPAAAARALAIDFFAHDLPGSGGWRVGGCRIDPAALRVPMLEVVSASDRIVPATASPGVGERLEVAAGHVGMVVGRRAEAELWAPLARWLHARRAI